MTGNTYKLTSSSPVPQESRLLVYIVKNVEEVSHDLKDDLSALGQ